MNADVWSNAPAALFARREDPLVSLRVWSWTPHAVDERIPQRRSRVWLHSLRPRRVPIFDESPGIEVVLLKLAAEQQAAHNVRTNMAAAGGVMLCRGNVWWSPALRRVFHLTPPPPRVADCRQVYP